MPSVAFRVESRFPAMRLRTPLLLLVFLFLTSFSLIALERQDASAYHARRVALSQKTNGGLVVLFAPVERSDEIFGFHQESNFYYLTGWTEPGAALLIAPAVEAKGEATGGHPYIEILFLPARNLTEERWLGPKLGPGDAEVTKITGFDRVEPLDKMHDELTTVLSAGRAPVYSDLGSYDQDSASTEPLAWLRRGQAFGGAGGFQEAKRLIAQLRTLKDQGEIDLVVKATRASMAGHVAALKAIHPGVGEREIQALMQYEYQRRGCERSAYAPIVGSGFNSTVLHYSADSGTMQSGDVVVMDVAGECSMYASDITRTAPVNGRFTASRPSKPASRISDAEARTRSTKLRGITLIPTARTCMAVLLGNTSFTDWAITSASMYMTRATTPYRWTRAWYSRSSRGFTFPKRSWACVLKTFIT